MLGLPKCSELSKQLPKKAIYLKFGMNTAAKEQFDADISRITIIHELTEKTLNISSGEEITSIYVLTVALKRKNYEKRTIELISKLIPQKMLFVLQYEEECRLAICHQKLMQTEWSAIDNAKVEIKGITLDAVWENLVTQIGGFEIAEGNTLEEQIAVNEERQRIEKEIARLEKLARAEKQPKKKFELVQKIKKLKTIHEA